MKEEVLFLGGVVPQKLDIGPFICKVYALPLSCMSLASRKKFLQKKKRRIWMNDINGMQREEVRKVRVERRREWEWQKLEKEKMEWVRKSRSGDGEKWCGNSHFELSPSTLCQCLLAFNLWGSLDKERCLLSWKREQRLPFFNLLILK